MPAIHDLSLLEVFGPVGSRKSDTDRSQRLQLPDETQVIGSSR